LDWSAFSCVAIAAARALVHRIELHVECSERRHQSDEIEQRGGRKSMTSVLRSTIDDAAHSSATLANSIKSPSHGS
jgi:hypothetical protein